MPSQAYDNLVALGKQLALIGDTTALLSWDQETHMPPQGLQYRAEQMAYFSGQAHELATRPVVGDWIRACEDEGHDPESDEGANLREWRFAYDRATKLPTSLVEEFEKTVSLAKAAWTKARKESAFQAFSPHLKQLIELTHRKVDCYGYDEHPYDALMDDFERGARTAHLEQVFTELRPKLVVLVEEVIRRGERVPADLLEGDYPIEQQQAFNREVARAIGFDFSSGRIDTAVHPFCSGVGPGDTRLTTRYDEKDFRSSLFGVLHEAGHGMYEQGLPIERHGQPLGKAVSLGVHESQSRLWENHVGRSRQFWEHWLPKAAEYFPNLRSVTPEEMYYAVNRVQRSHIRVEADEVTYDLHILLRFSLEKEIFSGNLDVDDIPQAWYREFESLLGLEIENDAEGCLQDIHWSLGIFGYFPTYSLGNFNAAQLYNTAVRENPDIKNRMDIADYSGLLAWMREKIHAQGSRYLPSQLIERVTGAPATAADHLKHLHERYL